MKSEPKRAVIAIIMVLSVACLISLDDDAGVKGEEYSFNMAAGFNTDTGTSFATGNFAAGQDESIFADSERQPKLIMVTEITGYFEADGVFSPDPWFSYPAPPGFVTANKDGEYSVCVYSGKGEQKTVTYFDVARTARVNTTEGPAIMENARSPVNVVVKLPEDATKIVIEKDGREIYARKVSKNKPEVSFTGLTEYQELPDKTTLTWDAKDADGDELYFDIYYCVGETESYLLAGGVTGNSAWVNLSDCPGSREGYFYIYATDGVNTAENHSDYVKVAYKAPLFITGQKETAQAKITDEIYFSVEIFDKQDGKLTGDEVLWTLDGEKVSATSVLRVWPFKYAPGTYTFTCTATNSAGVAASQDYTFEILDDESDLPDDWSRDDVRNALQNGFIASLTRIDAPVTRGEFARLMANLYVTFMPRDVSLPPAVPGNLVTDCGSDAEYPALMVRLGVMEAPGGRFDPSKSLTESEAMTIMYKVAMLAADQDLTVEDLEFDESKIVDVNLEMGVFDAGGPGAYQPEEKLSKKKALVRVSRLYNHEFK